MVAIANALESTSRAKTARLAGMERQALRDEVVHYGADGLAGPCNRPRACQRLDEWRSAALRELMLAGPDMEQTRRNSKTLPQVC